MKYVFLLIVIIITYVTASEEEDLRSKFQIQCFEEAKLSHEQLGKIVFRWEHTEEKEVHDYALCFVKKLGVFTEGTGFNIDRIVDKYIDPRLEKEKAREFVTKCVGNSEKNAAPATQAYLGLECLAKGRFDYS